MVKNDLLEVCKEIEKRIERWQRSGIQAGVKGKDSDFPHLVESLRAAIKKVEEGEQENG